MIKKLKLQIVKNKFFIIAFIIFFLTRLFVLYNYPKDYSDVKHDYERYANMWWYGLPPYLKHLYEYPPATIPLLITPLALDLAGIGIYYFNYRIQIFVIETIIYFFILKALNRIFSHSPMKYIAVVVYSLSCLIAKDFWYEGIDLVFTGSLTLALLSYYLIKKQTYTTKILFWALFWLSVAIKLITFPLLVPFLFIKQTNFVEEVKACFWGCLIIWGLPLLIFRSSLSVMLFFHLKRPLHASSFPAFITYTVNHFTKSEQMIKLEWFGPWSQIMLNISTVLLVISTTLVILWGLKKFFLVKPNKFVLMLQITIIYYISFIFSGKIFSPPFNIWYILPLIIFPFTSKKWQVLFYLLAIYSLVLNTTNFINLPDTPMIGPFYWSYLRNLLRWPALIILMFFMAKDQIVATNLDSGGR